MSQIYVESGLDLSAQKIAGSLTNDLSGVSNILVALAIACGIVAVTITIIRFFLSSEQHMLSVALGRIIRIALTVSIVAFIGYAGLDLAYSLGWSGM